MPTLCIYKPDDDHAEFTLDGKDIGSVDHDADGWGSMEKTEEILRKVAKLCGWKIHETYGRSY